jgi:hypothetical protein
VLKKVTTKPATASKPTNSIVHRVPSTTSPPPKKRTPTPKNRCTRAAAAKARKKR